MAIIKVTTDKIKKVIFKYPALFGTEQEVTNEIIKKYNHIKELEESLYTLRMKVLDTENEWRKNKEDFINMSTMFDLEFETEEIETIENETNMTIKGRGNDTLGIYNG